MDTISSSSNSRHTSQWIILGGYTAVILLIIDASFRLGLSGQNIVAVWPAAGVCAWVAIRYGWKCAPVIFVSHQAHVALIGNDLSLMLGLTNFFNIFPYLLANWAYQRLGGQPEVFSSVRSTLLFIVTFAIGISVLSGIIGPIIYTLFLGLPWSGLPALAGRWMVSIFSGVIFITPLFAAAFHTASKTWFRDLFGHITQLKSELLTCIGVIISLVTILQLMPGSVIRFPTLLLIMPLCIWLALNDKPRSSTILISLSIVVSVSLMLMLAEVTREATFLSLQPYAVVLMITSLVLRASSTERAAALRALSEERGRLEQTVEQRTCKLQELAETDALTGLANRRSFENAFGQCYQSAVDGTGSGYLLVIDLDQFKMVNDTSGHAAGDQLLKKIATVMRESVRQIDVVGRLGGDEFAIVVRDCPESVVRRIAEKIRCDVASLNFAWNKDTHQVGTSIGAVSIDPKHGSMADVMQMADAACYVAKNSGRNRVHMADGADQGVAELRGTAQWAHRLSDAMENNHFVLFSQKIMRITHRENEPEHVEILLRLRDPASRELILPGTFLPAAERYGLATRLDEWVVRELIRTLYTHSAFSAEKRRYWVNLSGASVGDERFVDFLIDAISNSPLEPGLINFEITETAVIRNVSEAKRLMKKLSELGCQFALDDFGTGLSSFSHLKQLPVDHLKIDGMFVRSVMKENTDRVFVKSIIDIAHIMGIKAVVEFVEDDAILAEVTLMGADYGQGYGIHRPEPLGPSFSADNLRPKKSESAGASAISAQ